jgi:hypothetical protein
MALKPTAYFQWVRRDTAAPTMVLQQWWTDWAERELHRPPGQCVLGEWRDIPIVEPGAKATKAPKGADVSDL